MRQFDVFQNPDPLRRVYAPFLVVLQSHHLDVLNSSVVAPLINDALRPLGLVDLAVDFEGVALVVAVAELAAVDARRLPTRSDRYSPGKMTSAARSTGCSPASDYSAA